MSVEPSPLLANFPLPVIEDLLHSQVGIHLWSSVDMHDGLEPMPPLEECTHLIAFCMPERTFECRVALMDELGTGSGLTTLGVPPKQGCGYQEGGNEQENQSLP